MVAPALVAVNPIYLGSWLDALRPVRARLIAPLVAIFRDKARPETEHILATNILAEYGRDNPDVLAELLMIADPKAYGHLLPGRRAANRESLASVQSRACQERPGLRNRCFSCGGSQGRAGRTAGSGGCGFGSHGKSRGCMASPSTQRRHSAPQLHHQLAETDGY